MNFLRVGWSNKQLTTLKPLLSEIEYLQDQHLLLTVKSLDGYESYGIKIVCACGSLKFKGNLVCWNLTNLPTLFRRVRVGSEVDDWQHSTTVPHLPVSPWGGNRKYPRVNEGQSPF